MRFPALLIPSVVKEALSTLPTRYWQDHLVQKEVLFPQRLAETLTLRDCSEARCFTGAQTVEATRHKQPVMQELMRKLTTEHEVDSRPGHVREFPLLY